ncbi:MAG: 2-succinyl-6-hydroxy-2,4-cyclohexadiene-1-carboxylate synthase [Candidatus Hydrogenedentes bacterium]|nr:2-succinyl-6-hydroxy-2,4-cyclohexadiene-1-carboxylate synthase [Candidatus Hydrogenedentota bacterium]
MIPDLAWHETRSTAAGAPAVLLLHGFLGSAREWEDVAQALTPTFRCLCPDLPGHGLSRAPEACGMTEVAHTIINHLDRLGVSRCAVVGYSMGGRLALFLAAHYPKRFTSAVLESASPGLRDEAERRQRYQDDYELARRLEVLGEDKEEFAKFLRDWFAQPLFKTLADKPESLNQLIAQRCEENFPRCIAAGLRAMSVGRQPSLWEILLQYRTPTLLIVGEEDRKFRFIAEEMGERCSSMATKVFPGCSHNVHFENPGGYTTVLKHFLEATT